MANINRVVLVGNLTKDPEQGLVGDAVTAQGGGQERRSFEWQQRTSTG